MIRKIFNFAKLKQHGQAMVLYALMVPVLFSFVGVTIDLGWLYMNKSRLQNAADAAALAGAKQLYATSSVKLVNSHEGELLNDETYSADDVASTYASKNLSNDGSKELIEDDKYKMKDSWNNSNETDVIFTSALYGGESNERYYVVKLEEKVEHLFKILDNISDTNIPVIAVAKITKNADGPDLYSALKTLEGTEVVGNWETQDYYYKNKNKQSQFKEIFNKDFYTGKWQHFKSPDEKVHYTTGDSYKTEHITIKDDKQISTSANGGTKYTSDQWDSINIDFKSDVYFFDTVVTTDWDIGFNSTMDKRADNNSGWNNNDINKRIHAYINFDEAYVVRENQTGTDPLWVRIESEPMLSAASALGINRNILNLNSVRQIIITVNASNLDEKYRPFVIFYMGPEKINPKDVDSDGNHVRDSQPVIINLNADFRAILFMPNSPVVINGNGHKFEGFVIAKEYRKLKTKEDFGSSYEEYTVDSNGNTILINPNVDGVLTKISDEEINPSKNGYTYILDTKPTDNVITQNATKAIFVIEDTNKYFYFARESYLKTGYQIYYKEKDNHSRDREVFIKEDSIIDSNEIGAYDINTLNKIYDKDKKEFYVKKDDALFFSDGWRKAHDINNQWYIFKANNQTDKDGLRIYVTYNNERDGNSNDKQYDSDKLYIPEGYTAVKDSHGNKAYINNKILNDSKNYLQATSEDNNKTIYIDKANTNDELYFTKIPNTIKCEQHNEIHKKNDFYIDHKGNVKYSEETVKLIKTNDHRPRIPGKYKDGEDDIYQASDFNLNADSHYDYFDIPSLIRVRYTYLNAKDTDDMFFWTERSKWIT